MKYFSIFMAIMMAILFGVSMIMWSWQLELVATIGLLLAAVLFAKSYSEENSDGA